MQDAVRYPSGFVEFVLRQGETDCPRSRLGHWCAMTYPGLCTFTGSLRRIRTAVVVLRTPLIRQNVLTCRFAHFATFPHYGGKVRRCAAVGCVRSRGISGEFVLLPRALSERPHPRSHSKTGCCRSNSPFFQLISLYIPTASAFLVDSLSSRTSTFTVF